MKSKQILYIINKRIFAANIQEALKYEKRAKVEDIYVDDKYRSAFTTDIPSTMGFKKKK